MKILRKTTKKPLSEANSNDITIKNTREGKRYITLYEQPIPDFTTSVNRQAELVKYKTEGKTPKEIVESMSYLLQSISTSKKISGDEMRSLSQILLYTSQQIS